MIFAELQTGEKQTKTAEQVSVFSLISYWSSLPKQARMRHRPGQYHFRLDQLLEQQPVRLNMQVAPALLKPPKAWSRLCGPSVRQHLATP
jgi:hypothetical protein